MGTGRRPRNVEWFCSHKVSNPLPSSGHSTPKLLDIQSAALIIISVSRTPFSISKPRALLGALAFWKGSVCSSEQGPSVPVPEFPHIAAGHQALNSLTPRLNTPPWYQKL